MRPALHNTIPVSTTVPLSMAPTPLANLPMIAVIDRDRLTAYGMALLLRDWGYDSVVGVSAADIFERSEGLGRPLAAIVADDRGAVAGTLDKDGGVEAAALARLAQRPIPTIMLVSTAASEGGGGSCILSLPKPVEPNMLREFLRHVTANTGVHD